MSHATWGGIVKNAMKHSIFRICRPLPSGPQAVPTYIVRSCNLIDEFCPEKKLPEAALLDVGLLVIVTLELLRLC